ncbi:MAG: hypothetical protein CSA66_07840 [Proteobacteria bacterium]|nr:MAG: hypothetical protein CSA66_07840 [Pseudomonadota bacterium]
MSRLTLTLFSLVIAAGGALGACGDDKGATSPTAASIPLGVSCASDADCGDLQPTQCQQAACGEAGVCVITAVADGTACSTGAVCVEEQVCQGGTCGGGHAPARDCGDKVCGTDACGNSCGVCAANFECTAAGQCEEIVDPCMGLSFAGCCTGDGKAVWCDGGQLDEQDCAAAGGTCGWRDDVGYYYCTSGDEPPAPDASLPYLCPDSECASADPCGDRECGHQCGLLCGTCGDGEVCRADGTCGEDVCGDLTFTGCCRGTLSYYCKDGVVEVLDCSTVDPASCGWDSAEGFYDCGLSGADPSGTNPADCDEYDFVVPK